MSYKNHFKKTRSFLALTLLFFSFSTTESTQAKPYCNDLASCDTAALSLSDFNRADWGRWLDLDHDCQNMRSEVLIRFSSSKIKFAESPNWYTPKTADRGGPGRCQVIAGKWLDPYSNHWYVNAPDLDIDHVIPLENAHRSGGARWTKKQKYQFANDYENLLPVDKSLNRQKGSKDPSEWIPPNRLFICAYVERWVKLKQKYRLSYTQRERSALSALHRSYCPPHSP